MSNLGYVKPDLYRATALQYITDRLNTIFGQLSYHSYCYSSEVLKHMATGVVAPLCTTTTAILKYSVTQGTISDHASESCYIRTE
jgi:hypothetical protein